MNRRTIGVKLTLAAVCLVGLSLVGCESLHHNLRPEEVDPEVRKAADEGVESGGTEVLDVKDDGKAKKKFFRNSRLPGGWSSEAREIEKDMGIQ